MAKLRRYGQCHLCGCSGPLSFEHIPPEAAFNDQKVLLSDIEKVLAGDMLEHLDNPKGRTQQRGAGAYTLCEQCNSKTGGWYGKPYVAFARQLFPYCWMPPDRVGIIPCTIKPLNVYKQILVMFCSASPPAVTQKNPELVRYLLNPESRDSGQERIYLGLYDLRNSKATRQSGLTGRINGHGIQLFSEISFPPFNLVCSTSGDNPDPGLTEITWFKEFAYGESADISLTLRNLAVNSVFPADYRSVDEIKRQAGTN
ncbi:hypothetical protein [uncultured Bradyrhizobium sp.]|uniref:hypothetical protein n=1 Tax=Bradyrhizobium sp. TaxID=376 RepID=UPI00260C7A09|nr:hypothetical protein [uncultured Bradyrhizobium sp.]